MNILLRRRRASTQYHIHGKYYDRLLSTADNFANHLCMKFPRLIWLFNNLSAMSRYKITGAFIPIVLKVAARSDWMNRSPSLYFSFVVKIFADDYYKNFKIWIKLPCCFFYLRQIRSAKSIEVNYIAEFHCTDLLVHNSPATVRVRRLKNYLTWPRNTIPSLSDTFFRMLRWCSLTEINWCVHAIGKMVHHESPPRHITCSGKVTQGKPTPTSSIELPAFFRISTLPW